MDEWQKERMRNALDILASQYEPYRDTNLDPAEVSTTTKDRWIYLRNNISDATGVDLGDPERLRQFVKGVPDKSKSVGRRWPEMKPKRLAAIKSYLTNPDNLLSPLPKTDLEDFAPDLQAPVYLLEFLDQRSEGQRGLSASQFAGVFVARTEDDELVSTFTLTFERPAMDALLQCQMFEDNSDQSAFEPLVDELRGDAGTRYKGWAIITNEDNLLIFMKNCVEEANEHVLSVLLDGNAINGDAVTRFAAFRQCYVNEYQPSLDDGGADHFEAHAKNVANDKILIFKRKS